MTKASSKSYKSVSSQRIGECKTSKAKKKENDDPNQQPCNKKYKYFSKKHKNQEKPRQKLQNSDMTVEVYLFENKTESKPSYEKVKPTYQRSPLNRSVENLWKGTKVKKSSSRPKINLPVYQKYINHVKKMSTSSNLKDLHRKMHSSIMNSFATTHNDFSSENRAKQRNNNYPGTIKGSSSFIFSTKSPLSTSKNTTSQNFILKNKKNLKTINNSSEDCKKKSQKSKKYKRTFSKKSIGSVTNTASYSTSKLKGSFVGKAPDNVSIIKYNSFINSWKISPSRAKSTERMQKKSHRKLDMNIKKPSCGQRKKSSSSKGVQKAQSTATATCTNKQLYTHLTRNPSKAEGFETQYSALMDTYTELMTKKRDTSNKTHK